MHQSDWLCIWGLMILTMTETTWCSGANISNEENISIGLYLHSDIKTGSGTVKVPYYVSSVICH